ncbi:hypothetical protein THOM_1573, partial [Trachipleistophora hominis]
EHLLLIISLCLATDTKESKDGVRVLSKEEDKWLIGMCKKRTEHVKVLFDTISKHIEKVEKEGRKDESEASKQEYEQALLNFKSETKRYSEKIRNMIDVLCVKKEIGFDTTELLYKSTIAYVSTMEMLKKVLDKKTPLEDKFAEEYDKSVKALNEKPDFSELFTDDVKAVRMSQDSNIELLFKDFENELANEMVKWFPEEKAKDCVDQVKEKLTELTTNTNTDDNQTNSAANPNM